MDILETIKTDIQNLRDYNDLIKQKINIITEFPNSPEKNSALQLITQVSELILSISNIHLDSIEKYKYFSELYTENQIKVKDILIQVDKITKRINEF